MKTLILTIPFLLSSSLVLASEYRDTKPIATQMFAGDVSHDDFVESFESNVLTRSRCGHHEGNRNNGKSWKVSYLIVNSPYSVFRFPEGGELNAQASYSGRTEIDTFRISGSERGPLLQEREIEYAEIFYQVEGEDGKTQVQINFDSQGNLNIAEARFLSSDGNAFSRVVCKPSMLKGWPELETQGPVVQERSDIFHRSKWNKSKLREKLW